MDFSKVKNIIFDLGGVILNIDPALTYSAFLGLGLEKIDNIRDNKELFNLLIKYEKGLISTPEFIEGLRAQTDKDISNKGIENAWNAMILDIPSDRIKVLEDLKKKYRVFLLSNTNELHFNVYNSNLKEQSSHNGLSSLFEKDYYSHEMGMRKPDIEIFQSVLDDSKLIASDTLFVDDMGENILAAQKVGMQVYHIKGKNGLMELF